MLQMTSLYLRHTFELLIIQTKVKISMKEKLKFGLTLIISTLMVFFASRTLAAPVGSISLHCPCTVEKINDTKAIVDFSIVFLNEIIETGDLELEFRGLMQEEGAYIELGKIALESIAYSSTPTPFSRAVPLNFTSEKYVIPVIELRQDGSGLLSRRHLAEQPLEYRNEFGAPFDVQGKIMLDSQINFSYSEDSFELQVAQISNDKLRSQSEALEFQIRVSDGETFFKKATFTQSLSYDDEGFSELDISGILDIEMERHLPTYNDHNQIQLVIFRGSKLIFRYPIGDILGNPQEPNQFLLKNRDSLRDSDLDGMSDFNERLLNLEPETANGFSTIPIEILFTTGSALKNVYNSDELEARLTHLLSVTNLALEMSELDIELISLGVLDVGDDSGIYGSQSFLHALRDRLGVFSDLDDRLDRKPDLLIHLASDDSMETGGRAHLNGNLGYGFLDYSHLFDRGTNTGVVSAEETPLVLAHEIGHIMGLAHSRRQQRQAPDSSSPGTFPWSAGFGIDTNFATVMSYASAFDVNKMLGIFSSPDLVCGEANFACGIGKDNFLEGADSAASLNTTAVQISAISNGFPPNIDLDGPYSVTVRSLDDLDVWGAIAVDSEDGDISSSINLTSVKIETDVVEYDYQHIYSVEDADGNSTQTTRQVYLDLDGDGLTNKFDTDIDGDGVINELDLFIDDAEEWLDSDADGLGDNADTAFNPDFLVYGNLVNLTNNCSVTTENLEFEINQQRLPGIGPKSNILLKLPIGSHRLKIYRNGTLVSDRIFEVEADWLTGWGCQWDSFSRSDLVSFSTRVELDTDVDGIFSSLDAFPNNYLYSRDSDDDAMPDAWETRYGLDPNDASDATSDQDNDGVAALDEFLAGTIPSGSLDIDGNGQYDALTDGLLLLRGMFLLSGDALISNAVASDAVFKTSEEVTSRIEMLGNLVDIDGNGSVDALTDGLVILRYLFNLRGDVLINDVIASDATVKTAEDVEGKIEGLVPTL